MCFSERICSITQNAIKEPPPPTAQHDPQEIYTPYPAGDLSKQLHQQVKLMLHFATQVRHQ